MSLDADIAAARTAYFDNADYEEEESIDKCKSFVTACRKLLGLPITRSANGARDGTEIELNPELIAKQQDDARRWLSAAIAATNNAGVIGVDFTDFRQ
jgi:hypothetical protein